jgi:dTDP-4-amino-4,6-dideoxygalactose transaminase
MSTNFIPLSDPHVTAAEIEAVTAVLQSPRLSAGPAVQSFEEAFAAYSGRRYAIAVSSGTIGMLLVLKAYGIGPGDEVIASSYSWRETAHAIALSGATPVFADIDYWVCTLVPAKAEACITDKTRAIIAANTNGHPAPWDDFRELAKKRGLILIEDSTEAIGSIYRGKPVGSFGDCAVFDFSQPGAISCGEGGMIVTDDEEIAYAIRRHRGRLPEERSSVSVASAAPYQAKMSDLSAALGLVQLNRIEEILALRELVTGLYFKYFRSFEGIKDPKTSEDADKVYWFLYTVHLGTRFSRSSRDAIMEDLKTEEIEAAPYSQPLHLQRYYLDAGHERGALFVTGKVAERAIALPLHPHLTETQIAFIAETMKDASVNVGAGSAIYL